VAPLAALDLAFSDDELEKALWALADDADPRPALDLLATTDDPHLREHAPDGPHPRGRPIDGSHRREHAVSVLGTAGQRHLGRLRDLAGRESHRPAPWLLLGASLAAAAWAARGTAVAGQTSDRQVHDLQAYVAEARTALRRAAVLDRADPVPWSELTGVVLGAPLHTTEPADVFQRAIALTPDLYGAHARHLTGLTRKWYGSQDKALAFARAGVAGRPDGDPLLSLIALAHIEGYVDGLLRGNVLGRFWRAWRYFAAPAVRRETDAAAGRLLAATSEHPWAITAHQSFAALYHQANNPSRARPHLERSGPRPALWPWRYFGDPEILFAAARHAAGLPSS